MAITVLNIPFHFLFSTCRHYLYVLVAHRSSDGSKIFKKGFGAGFTNVRPPCTRDTNVRSDTDLCFRCLSLCAVQRCLSTGLVMDFDAAKSPKEPENGFRIGRWAAEPLNLWRFVRSNAAARLIGTSTSHRCCETFTSPTKK